MIRNILSLLRDEYLHDLTTEGLPPGLVPRVYHVRPLVMWDYVDLTRERLGDDLLCWRQSNGLDATLSKSVVCCSPSLDVLDLLNLWCGSDEF